MNYMKEINAFYVWLETNSIPPSAINLWHALMNINNKAGWIAEFEVAKSVIEMKTGLKKDAYYCARKILKEKGRIDYQERGVKAAAFKILPFGPYEIQGNSPAAESRSSDMPTSSPIIANRPSSMPTSSPASTNYLSDIPTGTQNNSKQEKTKPQKTNTSAAEGTNYLDAYQLYFKRQPSAIQIQELNDLIDQEGVEEEAVCMAFQKATSAGAQYAYARKILHNWISKGIRTAAAAVEETKAFTQRKSCFTGRGTIRKERLPDWYQEPFPQAPFVPLPGVDPQETIEEKRIRLEKMQKQFTKSGNGTPLTCRPSG